MLYSTLDPVPIAPNYGVYHALFPVQNVIC